MVTEAREEFCLTTPVAHTLRTPVRASDLRFSTAAHRTDARRESQYVAFGADVLHTYESANLLMSGRQWSFGTPAGLVGEPARRAIMLIPELPAPVQPKLVSVVDTSASWRRGLAAEVGPTAALNDEQKLRSVGATDAPKRSDENASTDARQLGTSDQTMRR